MRGPTKHEIGVGVLMVASLGLLSWMSLQVGALDGWGVETLDVEVRLPDAAGLEAGAVVKVAGVEVGAVDQVTVDHDMAVLSLSLFASAQLREDAVAQVRARSLLGEKYLALMPASRDAPLLEDGSTLERSLPITELDELVNALGPMVRGPGGEELGEALEVIAAAVNKDPQRVERMLVDLESTLHSAAEASAALPGLVSDTSATLASVRGAVAEARPAIRRADRVLQDLEPAAQKLEPTIDEVKGLASDTRATVGELRAVIDTLDDSTDELETILANLSEIDRQELERLLRDEGIRVRFFGRRDGGE
jgi:phospholipid/cholesterol/gamma-HCH transport system substrate-binding protein